MEWYSSATEWRTLLFHFLSFALYGGYAYISRLHCYSNAQVVKLVNTRDLKSLDFGLAGSSPALGTIFLINELFSGMDDAIVSLQIFMQFKGCLLYTSDAADE